MNRNDLKKVLAGLTLAMLLSGTTLTFSSCKTTEHSLKKEEQQPSSEHEVKRKSGIGGPTGQA